MPEHPERLARELRISEAAGLIDAHGQKRDFETAKGEAARLKQETEAATPDFLLIGALTTSCLIRFFRPFAADKRNRVRVKEALSGLSPSLLAAKKRLEDWRNKHIAHSVNSFESNYLYAEWDTEPLAPDLIKTIDVAESRVIGLDVSDIDLLGDLCDYLIANLGQYIAEEKVRLLQVARAAPQSTVQMVGDVSRTFPQRTRIDKPRPDK